MERFERSVRDFSRYLEGIGSVFFLVMFLANLVDVVGAKFFHWPLPGALEIISFAQVLAISFSVALGLFLGTHLKIEFLATKMKGPLGRFLDALVSLCCLLLFALLIIYGFKYAYSLQISGEMGSVSKLPFYPFAYAFTIGMVPVLLYYLIDFIKCLRGKG